MGIIVYGVSEHHDAWKGRIGFDTYYKKAAQQPTKTTTQRMICRPTIRGLWSISQPINGSASFLNLQQQIRPQPRVPIQSPLRLCRCDAERCAAGKKVGYPRSDRAEETNSQIRADDRGPAFALICQPNAKSRRTRTPHLPASRSHHNLATDRKRPPKQRMNRTCDRHHVLF